MEDIKKVKRGRGAFINSGIKRIFVKSLLEKKGITKKGYIAKRNAIRDKMAEIFRSGP
jgi:hypothetical protein